MERGRNGWEVDQVLSRGPSVGSLDSLVSSIASLECMGRELAHPDVLIQARVCHEKPRKAILSQQIYLHTVSASFLLNKYISIPFS